jgi:hypothetical protein
MRSTKLFDVRNSSSMFIRIMKKYKKKNKNIFLNNKGYITHAIEEKREKLQLEEKDDMYIYKETKNIANMNELLINLYGNKAKKRVYDISKVFSPIKLDRKLFFPIEKNDEKDNNDKINLTEKYINKKGFMKLPLIFKNIISYNEKENKSTKNILKTGNTKKYARKKFLKLLNDKKDENENKDKKVVNIGINALKMTLNDKNKSKDKNKSETKEIKLKLYQSSKSNKNILLTQYPKNEKIKEYKYKKNYTNTDNSDIIKIKSDLILSENYISSLSNFKEELIKEEKQKRNYFNRNDYGCKIFKEKYNYLSNKYFSFK